MLKVIFSCGQEDRESLPFGPFQYVQCTYNTLSTEPDGSTVLAYYVDGWWYTLDGQQWSDFTIGGM